MNHKLNMKKVVLWLFIATIVAFSASGAIFASEGINKTFFGYSGQSNREIDSEKVFEAGGIKDITLNTINEDINIIPTDEKQIRIHFYGEYQATGTSPWMEAALNGDKLEVTIKHKPSIGANIGTIDNLKLDIYVPDNYTGAFDAATISAALDIKDLSLSVFKYHSISGGLSTNNFSARSTELSTTSGNMRLKGFGGNLEFKSVSGALNAEYVRFENNITLNTTSGDLMLKLPESAQFQINFSSVSGQLRSKFPLTANGSQGRNKFEGSVGNSSNNIKMKSISGDLGIDN